jgi:integrase
MFSYVQFSDCTALKFYLLTLPRVSKVLAMDWSQVDPQAKVWIIPSESTKTGVPFDAPLSIQAEGQCAAASGNFLRHLMSRSSSRSL